MSKEIVTRVIDALEKLRIDHMVVGSFSTSVWGFPRSTKDADFVVELGQTPVAALMTELGPDFQLESQMSFETITATMRYRVLHRQAGFLIELFLLSNDPHDQARFARRVQGKIDERRAFVPEWGTGNQNCDCPNVRARRISL
ncbi:MAG TPA: hypothetical protein VH518_00450 [Tepidisphaeraceae bacterium]